MMTEFGFGKSVYRVTTGLERRTTRHLVQRRSPLARGPRCALHYQDAWSTCPLKF